ncbi:OLC1v1023973C1 [Oldenlandia corymbosa var. corymbosa]|uniref:Riboflavin synthase n=1 Tax=Oldenlandia corymbosa var. corymbosa TaxID=529605 RepID=A0AAV1C240_OLDCO|nr:OLC1v1023973C1 [Oldenlandia corymbosa var. corymbosa]
MGCNLHRFCICHPSKMPSGPKKRRAAKKKLESGVSFDPTEETKLGDATGTTSIQPIAGNDEPATQKNDQVGVKESAENEYVAELKGEKQAIQGGSLEDLKENNVIASVNENYNDRVHLVSPIQGKDDVVDDDSSKNVHNLSMRAANAILDSTTEDAVDDSNNVINQESSKINEQNHSVDFPVNDVSGTSGLTASVGPLEKNEQTLHSLLISANPDQDKVVIPDSLESPQADLVTVTEDIIEDKFAVETKEIRKSVAEDNSIVIDHKVSFYDLIGLICERVGWNRGNVNSSLSILYDTMDNGFRRIAKIKDDASLQVLYFLPNSTYIDLYVNLEMAGTSKSHLEAETNSSRPNMKNVDYMEDDDIGTYIIQRVNGDHTKVDKDEFQLIMWDETTATIGKGTCFKNKIDAKNGIGAWNIEQKREYYVKESDGNTWYIWCKFLKDSTLKGYVPCRWKVRASLKDHGLWEIVNGCPNTIVAENNNRNVSTTLIAHLIRNKVELDSDYEVKLVQEEVKKNVYMSMFLTTGHEREGEKLSILFTAIGFSILTYFQDKHYRWGNQKTNISKSYNNVLKGIHFLPIRDLVEATFFKTVDLFQEEYVASRKCITPLPTDLWEDFLKKKNKAVQHKVKGYAVVNGKFKVKSKSRLSNKGGNEYTVKYEEKKCSCKKWQEYRMSCSLALAACRKIKDQPINTVDPHFRVFAWQDQFSGHDDFSPVPDKRKWPKGMTPEKTRAQWMAMCFRLLGFTPAHDMFDGNKIYVECLIAECDLSIPDDAPVEAYTKRARALMLLLLGSFLIPNNTGNRISLWILCLLEDLDVCATYSWRPAVLARLYFGLCQASVSEKNDITGCYIMMQIWAWEHIPRIQPKRKVKDKSYLTPDAPLANRWKCLKSKLKIFCWAVGEPYELNRVLRQFRCKQVRPEAPLICDSDRWKAIHHEGLATGKAYDDWVLKHSEFQRRIVRFITDPIQYDTLAQGYHSSSSRERFYRDREVLMKRPPESIHLNPSPMQEDDGGHQSDEDYYIGGEEEEGKEEEESPLPRVSFQKKQKTTEVRKSDREVCKQIHVTQSSGFPMAIPTSCSSISKLLGHSTSPRTPKLLNLLHTPLPPQPSQLKINNFTLKPPSLSHLFSIKPSKLFKTPSNLKPTRSLFTGIVEEMGEIKHLGYEKDDSFTMKIHAKTVLEDVHLGDSISVNGTCLTVTDFDVQLSEFTIGLAPETLRKTSLGELEKGSLVNLERALSPSTRMGGHFVQGHVDGTGTIVSLEPEGDSLWVKVKTGKELLKYIVPKGFIAVDGTSLTVVDVFDDEECFNFMLVDYTQQKVVIPRKKIGQKVNLEVDILGKYVERLLSSGFLDSLKPS